ncbi:MAG: DUF2232 domain-containing protein [Geobacteraceae bacterium]|nr:DUF2232 domain-containing protein [Geobacteraceae bacterium]
MRGREAVAGVIAGTLITLALCFSYVVFPIAGALAVFLVPFPGIYFTLVSGRKTGYCIIAAVMSVLAYQDQQFFFSYLFQWLPLTLLVPELILRGCGFARAIFIAVGVQMLLVSVLSCFMPGASADAEIGRIVDLTLAPMGGKIDKQTILLTKDFLKKIYPSCLVINSGVVVLCNMLLLRRFKKTREILSYTSSFLHYRNHDCLIWLLIGSGFALLIENHAVESIALNFLILALFLYLVQGLAVTAYFFSKSSVPRFLQPLFYLFLFVQPLLAVAVTACGLFDLWVDFRKPKKQENL